MSYHTEKEPINDLMKQLTEERDFFKQKKKQEKILNKGGNREAEVCLNPLFDWLVQFVALI